MNDSHLGKLIWIQIFKCLSLLSVAYSLTQRMVMRWYSVTGVTCASIRLVTEYRIFQRESGTVERVLSVSDPSVNCALRKEVP